jgi:AraC-like DNA-binding protein
MAQTDLNIGILFHKTGNQERAIEVTEKTLAIFEELGDEFHIALASMNLGTYYVAKGIDFEKAYSLLRNSESIFKRIGSYQNIANVYYHLAYYYNITRDMQNSITYATKAFNQYDSPVYNNVYVNSLIILINLHELKGDSNKSAECIDKILFAVRNELISSPKMLEDFWDAAITTYTTLSKPEKIRELAKLKNEFETRKIAEINAPLFKQFQVIRNLSPSYADSIKDTYAELDINPIYFRISTSLNILLIALMMGLLGYIYVTITKKRVVSEQVTQELVNEKIDLLIQKIENSGVKGISPEKQKHIETFTKNRTLDQLFVELETYLITSESYLDSNISREYIAKKLNTNVKYITEAIKKNTDLSFSEYLNRLRISKAILIMKTSKNELSIELLSEYSGYSSESSFYRNFKEIVGDTPHNFRAKMDQTGDFDAAISE